MKARFIGDPVERLSGRFTRPPSDEWFDVPEGREDKYRNNAHYETDEAPTPKAKPSRRKAAEPAAPPKPKIETDGWEEDE